MTWLIVAATEAEAAHVPAHLPLVITGIGKTQAAVAVTRALAECEEVGDLTLVNIGTAGALRPGITGLHEPGVVVNHDVNAEVLRALGHDPEERIVVGPGELVLASGDVFVTDTQVRDRLARDAHLVDMEAYAIAYAAHAFGVPVRLIKHVSDEADAGAMAWPELVEASAQVLGEWLRENCSPSAP